MSPKETIKDIIAAKLPYLQEKYQIQTMGIFGSYVRGEEKKRSDVDILVEFTEPISFFRFVDLELELAELIGRKVDLVMKSALKPVIGRRILEEVEYL